MTILHWHIYLKKFLEASNFLKWQYKLLTKLSMWERKCAFTASVQCNIILTFEIEFWECRTTFCHSLRNSSHWGSLISCLSWASARSKEPDTVWAPSDWFTDGFCVWGSLGNNRSHSYQWHTNYWNCMHGEFKFYVWKEVGGSSLIIGRLKQTIGEKKDHFYSIFTPNRENYCIILFKTLCSIL